MLRRNPPHLLMMAEKSPFSLATGGTTCYPAKEEVAAGALPPTEVLDQMRIAITCTTPTFASVISFPMRPIVRAVIPPPTNVTRPAKGGAQCPLSILATGDP